MSVQVIMHMRKPSPVTAETIGAIAPDPQDTRRVMRWFAEQGFDVGEFVGNSFSIAAPRTQFQKVFGRASVPAKGARPGGFPVDRLDPSIRTLVDSIAQTEPPDFGPPGGYA